MKEKTKILLCSVSLERKGGVTHSVRLIMDNLPKDKYQVKHFIQGLPPGKFMNLFLPIVLLIQLSKFKHELREFNPHIVHINPSLDWAAITRDYIFMRCAKKYGFSVLFFVGGWRKHCSKHFCKKNFLSKFFYKVFTMPDKIFVLANSFKNELIAMGTNSDKIAVTTTMVESEKFKPKPRKFNPPYTLLFCSRIEKAKGIFELLYAFQRVLQKYPKTKLIYLGNGSELKNLRRKIHHLRLEENVKCVGYKSGKEKIDYFNNADMLILPSYTEGFPNVFCEAMAAGLPYIGTYVGGLVDVFENEKQGLVIRSNPPKQEDISEKIITLIENLELMKQISKNNLQEAKKKYDVKVVMKKIKGIYEEMI